MAYVDGFVLPVPRRKLAAYRRIARMGGKAWKKEGALEYRECVADDVRKEIMPGFARGLKLKPGEVVVFSWIVYKSKADRNRINKKVMSLPEFVNMDPADMPVDMKRMLYGGFKTIVDL